MVSSSVATILDPEMLQTRSKGPRISPLTDHTLCLCRDRADERRRGITVEESAPSYLTAEETRYLGGSMERTHLVRGLDRLLLNQVRDKVSDRAEQAVGAPGAAAEPDSCLLYTSPSPRDRQKTRMPSSA